jgi:uncharacterized protein
MIPGLMIRSSSIHAAGCYTTRPIRKGTKVVQYDGPVFTKDEADERYKDRFITYLFSTGNGDVIDGFGAAMFINHSCDPNCETEHIGDEIWVVAIRNIAPGEELTYEYNLHDSDEEDEADCHCGASSCRGTMYSEDEVKRRARVAKRKTKA